MVRSKDELMELVRTRIGDDTSEEAISFIEDIEDTLTDLMGRDSTDWETKFRENDEAWRKRYKERFFMTPDNNNTTPKDVVEDNAEDLEKEGKTKSFEELFKEKDDNSGY